MGQPQVENGFIRIARELVDEFCRRCFNGQEWRILWAIMRKTYGYNKREDVIALSQFQKITGMDRKSVTRTLKVLKTNRVLIVRVSKEGNIYRINKNYPDWVVAKLPLQKLYTVSTGRGETASGETAPGVGASPRKEVGATPCVEPRGETAPHNRQIDNRQGTSLSFDIKTEIKNLKNLGFDNLQIKQNLMMREIPEIDIDEALGKKF
jgi:phage replication O-like protein O